MTLSIFGANGQLVRVPVPEVVHEGKVFHYTGAAGLEGIVGQNHLWASSALSLNDSSEVTYGLKLVDDLLVSRTGPASETLRELTESGHFAALVALTFVLSASELQDSLTQWVHYAGSHGYSLGLDTAQELKPVNSTGVVEPRGAVRFPTSPFSSLWGWWRKVVYERETQLEVLRAVLDVLDANCFSHPAHLESSVGALLPLFKDPGFSDEREVRFLIDGDESTVRSRSGSNGDVPFVELASWGDPKSLLPIEEVMIPPLNDVDERAPAEATARQTLDAAGYSQASVTFSSLPYRW